MKEHTFEFNEHTYVIRFVPDRKDDVTTYVLSVFEDKNPVRIKNPVTGHQTTRLTEEEFSESDTVDKRFQTLESEIKHHGVSSIT